MNTSRIIRSTLAVVLFGLAGMASADEPTREGYVTDTNGNIVRSGSGLCIHTGYWTPAMAIAECEGGVKEPAAAEPMAAPAPAVVVPPTPIVVTLSADALFDFNKATIQPVGMQTLDSEVVQKLKAYPQIDSIMVTGHADRIGSDAYNQNLSQQRADAVKSYLVTKGVMGNRVLTEAKGESDPVVSCDDIKGKANGKNAALIACLKPNRRVVIEIKAQH